MNIVLNLKTRLRLLFILVTLLSSQSLWAQNVTMFGGSSLAKECFDFSQTAAMTHSASRTDLETCNQAIFHGELNHRDLVATYVNRGIIHMAMEDYKSAARDYNRALRMADDVGEAYVNRGNLWFLASRFTEAIADYDKSLEFGIEKPHVAFLNRGMAYEQLGKLLEAKSDYEMALDKIDGWPAAQKRLDRVQGKIAKAAKTEGAS